MAAPPSGRELRLRAAGSRGQKLGAAAVVAAAVLFGSSFLVVQDAVEEAGPVPFLVVRFAIGVLVLLPLALRRPRPAPGLGRAGAAAGVALAAGYVLQTVGLQRTTTSVSAFLTNLVVVFVPLLSALVLRRRPAAASVVGVALALVGLGLLTGGDGPGAGSGEALTLGCALGFATHILLLDRVADRYDVVQLNVVQFAVVVALLAGPGLATGGYDLGADAWLAAAYTGVAVTAVAFGLQVWGQRHVTPTRTALLLLVEPVTAAALGYAAGERLGWAGALGAAAILAGIVVSEVGADAPVVKRPEEP